MRPGPWFLPVSGGWLPADSPWNWWQLGRNIEGYNPSAIVEACIGAYSQTVAMCPGDHWSSKADGGRERVKTSALSRLLRYPNTYQTISDFMLNLVRSLYATGNVYALGFRNNRYEVFELHLMNSRSCSAFVSEDGEIFYSLGGNQVVNMMFGTPRVMVPSRDVLHVRLHSGRLTLLGETPLEAAMNDVGFADAATRQQISFYVNQARPGTVLSTDMVLDKETVEAIRQRWNDQTQGMAAGGTPILTAGLKPVAVPSVTAKDAELASLVKLSDQHIAAAFRIPLQILGLTEGAGGATEELMRNWISSGLGFCLNHIEEALGNFYDLSGVPDEYVEFDTTVLMRSDLKTRIEAMARGVQGSIFSPNEARKEFDMPKVEFGDEPRAQQQLVPLSAAAGIPSAPGQPPAKPASPQPAPKLPVPPPQRGIEDVERALRRRLNAATVRHQQSAV